MPVMILILRDPDGLAASWLGESSTIRLGGLCYRERVVCATVILITPSEHTDQAAYVTAASWVQLEGEKRHDEGEAAKFRILESAHRHFQ